MAPDARDPLAGHTPAMQHYLRLKAERPQRFHQTNNHPTAPT